MRALPFKKRVMKSGAVRFKPRPVRCAVRCLGLAWPWRTARVLAVWGATIQNGPGLGTVALRGLRRPAKGSAHSTTAPPLRIAAPCGLRLALRSRCAAACLCGSCPLRSFQVPFVDPGRGPGHRAHAARALGWGPGAMKVGRLRLPPAGTSVEAPAQPPLGEGAGGWYRARGTRVQLGVYRPLISKVCFTLHALAQGRACSGL